MVRDGVTDGVPERLDVLDGVPDLLGVPERLGVCDGVGVGEDVIEGVGVFVGDDPCVEVLVPVPV